MELTRIGVIGAGYWGPNLIRNIHEIPNAELVAVADLREDRLQTIKSRYREATVTTDYRELFKMGLDGIIVATPPLTHYLIAKEALMHGVNVMIEKPMATNTRQAEELIELASKKKMVLMVGHTFVFNTALDAVKKLMQSGDLGRVLYIDTARLSLGLYQNGLNVLWDLAPHDLSIIFHLLEQYPESIEVFGAACVINGIEDIVHMNIKFPDNILAHINVSWLAPVKVRRVTVVGSKKMVVFNDVDPIDKIKIYDKGVEISRLATTYAEWQCSYRAGDILIPSIQSGEPLRIECQHFLDCITQNIPCKAPGEEGLWVVKILETAQRVLENGHFGEDLKW